VSLFFLGGINKIVSIVLLASKIFFVSFVFFVVYDILCVLASLREDCFSVCFVFESERSADPPRWV